MSLIRYDTTTFIISSVLALVSFVAVLIAAVVTHWRNTHTKPEKNDKKPTLCRKRLANVLYGIAAVMLCLFTFAMSGFNVMPWWVAGILSTFIYLGMWAFKSEYARMVASLLRRKRPISMTPEFRRKTIVQLVPLVAACAMWFWFCWAVSDACVMFYPHSLSTRLTRIATRDVCQYRDPCHVYLMVGSDIAHEMILHVHSSHRYRNLSVFLDSVSHPSAAEQSVYPIRFGSQEYVMTHLETERVLYYSTLANLTADTRYWFRVVDSNPLEGYKPVFSEEFSFTTGPESGLSSTNFSFVTGGDIGVTPLAYKMTPVAGEQGALFAALGGDLSYDNGIPACYRRWDEWFDMLASSFKSPDGRLTPYMTAPGNHEAGSFRVFDPSIFSFYRQYFVQENPNGRSPLDLPSYSAHRIGSMLMLALDSDVYVPAADQVQWIQNVATTSPPYRWLTAIYHHPMWRSRSNNAQADGLKRLWGPLFARFGVDLVFENHDHAYKRTKPLVEGQVSENGTIFVGDGNWGTNDFPASSGNRNWIQFISSTPFVLRIDVSDAKLVGSAISDQRQVLDSFETTGFDPQ